MTNDGKSLADQHTFDGEPSAPSDANSFGDEMTFAGVDAELDNDLNNDGMEIIDLAKRYKFEGELGKGGMGEVLLATDTRLERKVAIKRILGKAVRNAKAYRRFLNGAQAIAGLNHPNIVRIYDFGNSTDGPFMILECVNGGSLLDRCKQGAIPLEEAINITCQLCDGIGKAHAAGIIHRDIKPANILMTEDGIPKLNDFDLAKAETADTEMTQEGAVLGTLDFMPPEQRQDAALVDQRSDLWSLAATLYQMVTGKSPKIINFKDVPKSLHDVLGKALEESPDDRYQNSEEFKNAIQRINSRLELSVSSRIKHVAFKPNCCPCCGVEVVVVVTKGRRSCGGCHVDLKAQCFSCEAEIDAWELNCPECGANQAELAEAAMVRCTQEQAQAEEHLQENRYASSHKIAMAQHNISDPRLHPAKKWAESFLKQIIEVRQRDLDRVVQLINQATRHGEAKDYLSAIQALEQVPKVFATVQFGSQETTPKQLYDLFSEKQEAIVSLEARIRALIAGNHFAATLPLLDDLLESQPHRKDLTELKDEMLNRQATMMAEREKTFNQAKRFFETHQYGRCRESLATIDETLVDESILSLDQQAQSNIDRLQELQNTIQLRQNEKDFHGLLEIVSDCLALQPDASDMQALSVQLQEWEDQRLATRKKALEEAKDHFGNHRFAACLSSLTVIDDSLPDEPVLTLRNQAKSRVKQLQELRRRIETAQEQYHTFSAEGKPCSKKIQALITLLSELLELDPNEKHFIGLHQQLAEHAERLKETRKQAFAEAQQYFNTQNYQDCLNRIDDIDTDLHDQKVVALQTRAADDFNRLKELRRIIQQRVKEKHLQSLLPLLEECLALEDEKADRYQAVHGFRDGLRDALMAPEQQGIASVVGLEVGECQECHKKNESSRKFCVECAVPLRVDCLSCNEKIPVWDKICGECGKKQLELAEKRKKEIEKNKLQAESLASEYQFEKAIALAEQIAAIHDNRYNHQRDWSITFLEVTNEAWEREQQSAQAHYAESQKHRSAFDYKAAIDAIEAIPGPMRSPDVVSYLSNLESDKQELSELIHTIKRRVKSRDLGGLLAMVERAIELKGKPGNLAKLQQQLRKRKRKRGQPNKNEEPLKDSIFTLHPSEIDAVNFPDEVARTMSSVEKKVIIFVADQLGVDKQKVKKSSHFVSDLGADSLGQKVLVNELIKSLVDGVDNDIPDQLAEAVQTVGEAIHLIENW